MAKDDIIDLMKGRRILIHVGLHKTASTFLQQKVFPSFTQYEFLGKSYLGYNSAFNRLIYGDDTLYQSSEIRQELRLICDRMVSTGASGLILSEEEFSGHPEYNYMNRGTVARRLAEIFPNAEILLVLRGQLDMICSLYNQFVKVGRFTGHLDRNFLHSSHEGMTLAEWFDGKNPHISGRFINHQSFMIPDHFRYSAIYSFYASLFPKVHVLLFEELQAAPMIFMGKLASILSAPLPESLLAPVMYRELVNEGVSSRRLNALLLYHRLVQLGLPLRQGRRLDRLMQFLTGFMPDRSAMGREYVARQLRDRDVVADNQRLDDLLSLGMGRFSKQYFDLPFG
ncbi:hypothetical protein [Synechococcus sp. CS-1332]|uniref:hypothetical protein n=1 Tax=Synechococcus sp. CS-1332 TaxID=2847972 RepID=UPI00223BA21F|nr:hypothetical protein [Synechococcus sp. CS-1332]MCT0206584.1 hypothetical protein [Synechococcus sp. CS-1332]